MKKLALLPLLIVAILFSTCSEKEENPPPPSSTTLAAVGNNWAGTIGGEPMEVVITANNSGIATANVDIFGTIYSIKGKVTDNEIADFVYSEGDESSPYTLVKFDADVGDEYIYTKGVWVITRTVLQKNVEIFVESLNLYVSCFVVEEIVPEGLQLLGQSVVGSKIKYWINHKYGIVSAELTTTWGDIEPVVLLSTNVGG